MKKYRNSILMVIVMLVLAIGAKECFKEFGYIQVDSSINVNRYLFYSYIALSLILILFISYYSSYIIIHNKKIDRENIPEAFEKKLGSLLFVNGIWGKLSIVALAITVNRNFYLELKQFGRIPTWFLAAALVMSLILTKYCNYLYPDRKTNPFENGASEKSFNKLDEGQKWIVYKSSYEVLNKMDKIYYILFCILILLSVFIELPLSLPLVVGLLSIIQTIIRAFEAKKFNL